jgi:hypothetical protein
LPCWFSFLLKHFLPRSQTYRMTLLVQSCILRLCCHTWWLEPLFLQFMMFSV